MNPIEGRAQKTIKQLEKEGRIVSLSSECTANIDHQLAIALASIKEDFNRKHNASRAYIAEINSTVPEV